MVKLFLIHRIITYPELERTHKAHWVTLLVPGQTNRWISAAHALPSRPFPIFIALLWVLSKSFMSSYHDTQIACSAGHEATYWSAEQDNLFPCLVALLVWGSPRYTQSFWLQGILLAEIQLLSAKTLRFLSVWLLSSILSPTVLRIQPGLTPLVFSHLTMWEVTAHYSGLLGSYCKV